MKMTKANHAYEKGQFKKAALAYDEALKDEDFPTARQNAALSYYKWAKTSSSPKVIKEASPKALEHFRALLATKPTQESIDKTRRMMTEVWREFLREPAKAIAFWTDVHQREPDNEEAFTILAELYDQAGDWREATKWSEMKANARDDDEGKSLVLMNAGATLWGRFRTPDRRPTGMEALEMADKGISLLLNALEHTKSDGRRVSIGNFMQGLYYWRSLIHQASWAWAADQATYLHYRDLNDRLKMKGSLPAFRDSLTKARKLYKVDKISEAQTAELKAHVSSMKKLQRYLRRAASAEDKIPEDIKEFIGDPKTDERLQALTTELGGQAAKKPEAEAAGKPAKPEAGK